MSGHAAHGCYHCGLPIPADADFHLPLAGAERAFCCFGCQSVCQAIHEAGLQGYYQRTPDGQLLAPPPEPPKDADIYDLDEIQQEFTTCSGDQRDIHLLVDGIHCAACIWLIERGLSKTPGVLSAQANLASKRVHVRWDNRQIKLSGVIHALSRIGYSAVPYDPESAEGAIKRANRAMLYRLFFAAFTMMNMFLVSIALYGGASDSQFRDFFHWLGFALATPTLFYSGYPFFKGALGGLRAMRLTMDLPIVIGLCATYAYSTWVTVSGTRAGEVYFDTVNNLIFVILIGRYLEGMFRHEAVSATKRLMELQPRAAIVVGAEGEQITPIRAVKMGDRVLIKPGAKVPVDGIVLEGVSEVDEAMLSGESRPVTKQPGDSVSAGTVNQSGTLLVEARVAVNNTVLARIIRLVEEAQTSKAPIQRIADRIVPWFVLATLVCATITFLIWRGDSFELALMAATSVLIITCPCALGMATPMSIAVASGLGAKHGILVKNGLALETLANVTHFVFDKTGTLTEGRLRVVAQESIASDARELWRRVAAVERLSEHAVAQAVVAHAEAAQLKWHDLKVEDFVAAPGRGVQGVVAGERIRVGRADWLAEQGVALEPSLLDAADAHEARASSVVHVAVGTGHVALFALADQIRPDAPALVAALKRAGVRVTLLSGDRRAVAEAVAAQLGGMEVIAEVLPQDKDQVIQRLQGNGDKVAMVGDGVNDAPALVRADVGIALGSGTDVSVESADIVLMRNELIKVLQAMQLSRRTLRTIKQNIGLSFVYNAIMVPLAMAAKVSPVIAAITMPISSLVVIGNAARIRTLFRKEEMK